MMMPALDLLSSVSVYHRHRTLAMSTRQPEANLEQAALEA
jgi:hypothetical protein